MTSITPGRVCTLEERHQTGGDFSLLPTNPIPTWGTSDTGFSSETLKSPVSSPAQIALCLQQLGDPNGLHGKPSPFHRLSAPPGQAAPDCWGQTIGSRPRPKKLSQRNKYLAVAPSL